LHPSPAVQMTPGGNMATPPDAMLSAPWLAATTSGGGGASAAAVVPPGALHSPPYAMYQHGPMLVPSSHTYPYYATTTAPVQHTPYGTPSSSSSSQRPLYAANNAMASTPNGSATSTTSTTTTSSSQPLKAAAPVFVPRQR
jgi:hypothetical protein